MTFLGWKLVRAHELALETRILEEHKAELARRILSQEKYIAACEKLIDKERARADAERERADRQLDGYLQSTGLPPVTSVVRDEQASAEAEADRIHVEHMRELSEIGRDSMEAIYTEDGFELPPALAKKAEELLSKGAN